MKKKKTFSNKAHNHLNLYVNKKWWWFEDKPKAKGFLYAFLAKAMQAFHDNSCLSNDPYTYKTINKIVNKITS